MLDTQQAPEISDATVYDSAGEKVGKVGQLYLSDHDGEVEWLTVTTGLFGMKQNFVPARDATYTDGDVRVSATKAQIKDAPQIDDDSHLDGSEEQQLYDYYQLSVGTPDSGSDAGGRPEQHEAAAAGQDTSGPNTDEAMTRSKEEFQVGTQTVEAGKARLRKYVTTEQQSVTVPVRREGVRVEREPITDDNRDQATTESDRRR